MLNLPAEEDKMPISGMTVSMATTCTPAGRRRGHIRPTIYEYQKHGERAFNNHCNSGVRDAVEQNQRDNKSAQWMRLAPTVKGANLQNERNTDMTKWTWKTRKKNERSKASTVTSRPATALRQAEGGVEKLISIRMKVKSRRTTTDSGTLPSRFRLKRTAVGDTCKRAVLWVGGRPCGEGPPDLSGNTTPLLLAAVRSGHDMTHSLEAPNGAFATPGSPDVRLT